MSHRDDVIKHLGLGPGDLEANRAGRLGPRQQRALVASGWRNAAAGLVAGLVLAAILAFIANKPLKPVQFVVCGILYAAAQAAGLYDLRRCRAAARDGRVGSLTGPIEVRSEGQAGWKLEVSGRTFALPLRPWQLKNGQAYRVYYSERANRIVALEPMDP